jgi:hypothetical protein
MFADCPPRTPSLLASARRQLLIAPTVNQSHNSGRLRNKTFYQTFSEGLVFLPTLQEFSASLFASLYPEKREAKGGSRILGKILRPWLLSAGRMPL